MLAILQRVEIVMLIVCADRFSANLIGLAYVWQLCDAIEYDDRVIPHYEPCWPHGQSLGKSSVMEIKEAVATSISFSKLMWGSPATL